MTRYLVSRTRYVVESIVQEAESAEEAIELSRHAMRKDWTRVYDKKRGNYSAGEVVYTK